MVSEGRNNGKKTRLRITAITLIPNPRVDLIPNSSFVALMIEYPKE